MGQFLLNKWIKSLIFAAILFLFPFYAQAGFPECENGYDLKKIEESFRLPCDEIGNDDCIARALGVGACTWVFGINKDKEPAEALKIADSVLIALLKVIVHAVKFWAELIIYCISSIQKLIMIRLFLKFFFEITCVYWFLFIKM